MPVPLSGVFIMDEEEILQDTLNRFINSHEQTYEEFFSSFTNLCRDEIGPWTRTSKKESVKGHQTPSQLVKADGETSAPTNAMCSSLSDVSQALDEDQLVLVEGLKSGGCNKADVRLQGRVRVDNYFTLEDFKSDERSDWKRTTSGTESLPGEVEEEETYYHPSFTQCTQLQIRTGHLCNSQSSTAIELPGDDVLPFSLDEEFDYDNVELTPKFSETEVKVMIEASRQQLLRTVDFKPEES
ncbi:intraflagellar transport-associated protein isoform X2 [Microcaecilia unicolor]|uniref:Protein C11orf74 homolog isoform X2 n=1 Tax=Microcaecilia unicolor TaxID=1415580 RepID=A0A6P7XY04_9AMPH|nr:protein C11orf74 homolog isoform X2 [Microcaecilia unicolor]